MSSDVSQLVTNVSWIREKEDTGWMLLTEKIGTCGSKSVCVVSAYQRCLARSYNSYHNCCALNPDSIPPLPIFATAFVNFSFYFRTANGKMRKLKLLFVWNCEIALKLWTKDIPCEVALRWSQISDGGDQILPNMESQKSFLSKYLAGSCLLYPVVD